MSRLPRPLLVLLLVFVGSSGSWAAELAKPIETKTLHNVFQVDGTLYSGNAPEDDAGFQELVKLGVKTIISVDGSKPNVELAHKYGMHYVHLPIGYDGVPQARAAELTKAAQQAAANGPIYLHCHHGKHRGPAAAAAICRARDGWTPEQAVSFLQQAGTAPDYAGLFRDVRAFIPPSTDELARLPSAFPETSKTPALVDAMVSIDEHFDDLKAAQKTGWKEVPGHPDLQPAQPAVLLWELLREHARDPETAKRGADYTAKLADGEKAADALRQILRDAKADNTARDNALQAMTKTCGACHKAHRN